MDDSNLSQPLQQSDSASVASSQGSKSVSLLERIKAQREREAAMRTSGSNNTMDLASPSYPSAENFTGAPATSDAMEVMGPPSYSPINPNEETQVRGAGSGFFRNFFRQGTPNGAGESLLQDSQSDDGAQQLQGSQEDYSMTGYFQTFVHDVYFGFRSIPLLAQMIIILVLLFLVYKLI